MIKILNDLPNFCEDCPYLQLYHIETLASGRCAYSCRQLRQCLRLLKELEEREKEDKE